ncbi:MAG: hypothetical protein R6W06_11775, partial [Prochlorococcaceae cyanobacterium]
SHFSNLCEKFQRKGAATSLDYGRCYKRTPRRGNNRVWIWAIKWGMQKRKTFRPWQPEQTSLLPASPSDWLTADHQVYFLLDLVDELDLSAMVIPAQSKDPRGEKGFDPRM